jgi:hypothetical protein
LSFEIIALLQADLLAFNPVGRFLNHRLQFAGVVNEEAVRIAFFAGECCFPRATDGEIEAAGGLSFPDGCGDGSVADSSNDCSGTRKEYPLRSSCQPPSFRSRLSCVGGASIDAVKLVTISPHSAVRLFVCHLRFMAKSRVVENQFDRRILVTESPELVLTEDDIPGPLLPLKTDGRG